MLKGAPDVRNLIIACGIGALVTMMVGMLTLSNAPVIVTLQSKVASLEAKLEQQDRAIHILDQKIDQLLLRTERIQTMVEDSHND